MTDPRSMQHFKNLKLGLSKLTKISEDKVTQTYNFKYLFFFLCVHYFVTTLLFKQARITHSGPPSIENDAHDFENLLLKTQVSRVARLN